MQLPTHRLIVGYVTISLTGVGYGHGSGSPSGLSARSPGPWRRLGVDTKEIQMAKFLGAFADRMVAFVVPKTTAGACPCFDCYFVPCAGGCMHCCDRCFCQQPALCGPCNNPPEWC